MQNVSAMSDRELEKIVDEINDFLDDGNNFYDLDKDVQEFYRLAILELDLRHLFPDVIIDEDLIFVGN